MISSKHQALKRSASLTFFVFRLLISSAQTESEIRNYYSEVNQQVKKSLTDGYEGSLYQNQLIINKNAKSWPAVGYYADTTNFWYNDTPDHTPEIILETTLLKVITSRRISADVKTSEEYLFKNGKLLFYYAFWGEEDKVWETRVYFNFKTAVLKSSFKKNGVELSAKDLSQKEYNDLKPKPATILAEAKKYQSLFVDSF